MSDIAQENQKSTMERFHDAWMSGIGVTVHDESTRPAGNDITYVRLKPKWKWFSPPLSIKIFKWEISFGWAFEVEKAYLLKDWHPIATKTETKPISVEFQGASFSSPVITEVANRLKEQYASAIFTDKDGKEIKLNDEEMNAIIQEDVNSLHKQE